MSVKVYIILTDETVRICNAVNAEIVFTSNIRLSGFWKFQNIMLNCNYSYNALSLWVKFVTIKMCSIIVMYLFTDYSFRRSSINSLSPVSAALSSGTPSVLPYTSRPYSYPGYSLSSTIPLANGSHVGQRLYISNQASFFWRKYCKQEYEVSL